jgi:hypothetical protein
MVRAIAAGLIAFVVALVLVSAGMGHPLSAAPQIEPEMAGTWTGEARIAVNWTTERTLRVRVTIQPDGAVTGTIGDATINDGRLEPNRSSLERALHIKTDWIIRGALEGDVIHAEQIHRDGVMVPLNFIGGRFEGGVNTSGTHFGGKDTMWLAAGGLVLERVR